MACFSFDIRVAGMEYIHKLNTKMTSLSKNSKLLILLKQIRFGLLLVVVGWFSDAGSLVFVCNPLKSRKIVVLLQVV